MKLIPAIPQESDDVTSDFDNIVEYAKDCGILFILLLGRDRSRKSANHGLPAFVRSLRNLNNNGYYRLRKWAAIALARYLAPARGLDPWRRPKGSWALGTRMTFSGIKNSIIPEQEGVMNLGLDTSADIGE